MNLTDVRYQDNCIYIGLNGSQDKRENGVFLKDIRNVYVFYKVKAFDRQVRETVLIGNKDLLIKGQDVFLKFELNELWHPEECEFELMSLKFTHVGGKIQEVKIGRSFRFLEISYSTRVDYSTRKKEPTFKKINEKKDRRKKQPLKLESKIQPKKAIVPVIMPKKIKKEKKEKFEEEETRISPGGFTIIEEITQIYNIVKKVESKIQNKVDARTKKLDRDIKNLCYETIDLLLSNLPQPELIEEYRASNAMVRSIHRYINTELLQDGCDGGEST